MAVVVHSVEHRDEPQILRPQEVRTVEVPWYEEQVGVPVCFPYRTVVSRQHTLLCLNVGL